MAKFLPAISFVLKNEGGLVDLHGDQGEITNFGISLRFYRKNVKIDGEPDDIRNLTSATAEGLYKRYFWDRNPYSDINSQHIANRLFDLAVNTGPATAIGMVQKAINILDPKLHIIVDGTLGPKTLDKINNIDEPQLYNTLICEALRYYHDISKQGENNKFLIGWINRLMTQC